MQIRKGRPPLPEEEKTVKVTLRVSRRHARLMKRLSKQHRSQAQVVAKALDFSVRKNEQGGLTFCLALNA